MSLLRDRLGEPCTTGASQICMHHDFSTTRPNVETRYIASLQICVSTNMRLYKYEMLLVRLLSIINYQLSIINYQLSIILFSSDRSSRSSLELESSTLP